MTAYELWIKLGEIISEHPDNHDLKIITPVRERFHVYREIDIVEILKFHGEIKEGGILKSINAGDAIEIDSVQ